MRRAHRFGMLMVLVAALASAAAVPAGACSIVGQPVAGQVTAAAIAFTGTVQKVDHLSAAQDAVTVTPDRFVTGHVDGAVTLTAARAVVDLGDGTSLSDTCAVPFAPGQRWAFLLARARPPWPVDLANVLDEHAFDAIAAPSEFHATAITALFARPARRSVRVAFTAPRCAALTAIIHERAAGIRLRLRTATTPACIRSGARSVRRCVTLTLKRVVGRRPVHPHRAARRTPFGSRAACPRARALST